jgi:ParB family transcriptional regulator, chromosome partitioning protein
MKRKALGKGLSALLPEADRPVSGTGPHEVAIADLEPNPHQPRSEMAEQPLRELVASIREHGIVQPLLVRRHAGRLQIIAGERRWRAAREAGLQTVPVTERNVPDDQLLELALIENIQRAELTPLEEAHAYQRLREEFGHTQEEIARRVGRERSTVANAMRLLRAPAPLRELLAQGRLDSGHVRALLTLEDAEAQLLLAREAARKGWSVREVERRVAQARDATPKRPARRDPNTRAAEEKLRSALGTRVDVVRRGARGTLRIAFSTEAELNRLYELLLRAGRG